MTNSDEYNGWTNRETWALNLWLSNDQGLDSMTRERAYQAVDLAISNARHAGFGTTGPGTRFYSTQAWIESDLGQAYLARKAGQAVKSLTENLFDPKEQLLSPEAIISMLQDIGSLHRVNWDEIGAAFLTPPFREEES